jgi:hypothetical protein
VNKTLHALLAGGLTLLLGSPVLADDPAQTELSFEVLLDGKPIGTHEFRITDGVATRIVETNASFDVRILFVPVFSYQHSNTEIWQNGCLQRISSETDSNGTPYRVTLNRADDGYRVITLDDSVVHPVECMMTFAYWDRDFLQQPWLLNSQTGELIDVEIETLGTDTPDWLPMQIPLEGYRIVAEPENVDIRVFYDQQDGRWVALESVLESGRVMRYLPTRIPQSVADTAVAAASTER